MASAGRFEWKRGEMLALAMASCSQCYGLGAKLGRDGIRPCNCVLRAVFRTCFRRFLELSRSERTISSVSIERYANASFPRQRSGSYNFGRKNEEYIADFELLTRRSLDDNERQLFKLHFLLGLEWPGCTGRLQIDRGNFFHAVYRIEEKLGRTFRETRPYSLFPIDEYFHGGLRG
jgi:hypothetical protein